MASRGAVPRAAHFFLTGRQRGVSMSGRRGSSVADPMADRRRGRSDSLQDDAESHGALRVRRRACFWARWLVYFATQAEFGYVLQDWRPRQASRGRLEVERDERRREREAGVVDGLDWASYA